MLFVFFNKKYFQRISIKQQEKPFIQEAMNIEMFIVGFVIFSGYLYFLIWNIITQNRKQRESNYPDIEDDSVDYDGMGNYGRFPEKEIKKRK